MHTTLPPTAPNSSAVSDAGLEIAQVERETGLGKDTLRVWEKRYNFPVPSRDAYGHRLYSAEQVLRLKLISRLLDAGWRPNKVVGLQEAQLQALIGIHAAESDASLSKTKDVCTTHNPLVNEMLETIGRHDKRALEYRLSHAQLRMGLAPFITELVAPLTTAVGEAWARGQFEVFEEHLYTEVISGVLRHAISSLPASLIPQAPKVLLTTIPQEQHGLGLLMVEALLSLEDCSCVSLGTQTPLTDIVQAARVHHVNAVVLSFSNQHKATVVHNSLRQLRTQLPQNTALWVGGSCAALYQSPVQGVSAIRDLAGLSAVVAQWRRHTEHLESH